MLAQLRVTERYGFHVKPETDRDTTGQVVVGHELLFATVVASRAVSAESSKRFKPIPGSTKTKIFVAHASADKPRLKPMVLALIECGFQLWIDKPHEIGLGPAQLDRLASDRIQYGDDWKESIRLAVASADAVLACWSNDVIEGRREQFHYEVYMGLVQGKLSQCRIDNVSLDGIGMPYTFHQIANLEKMAVNEYHADLDYLMRDMAARRQRRWVFW